MNKKILSMFSLCQKAGFMLSGELSVEKAIQNKSALLVITAGDASENTKEKFKNKTLFYNIPFYIKSEKEVLSQAIGKANRSVFAVTSENFSKRIIELFEQDNN